MQRATFTHVYLRSKAVAVLEQLNQHYFTNERNVWRESVMDYTHHIMSYNTVLFTCVVANGTYMYVVVGSNSGQIIFCFLQLLFCLSLYQSRVFL